MGEWTDMDWGQIAMRIFIQFAGLINATKAQMISVSTAEALKHALMELYNDEEN